MISPLPEGVKPLLRRTNPMRIAILGFAVSVVIFIVFLSYIADLSSIAVIGSVATAAGLAFQLYKMVLSLHEDPTLKDNKRFRELANLLDELESDLTDYERVTRVLEAREVELDAVLEQTNASRGVWIAFGDQELNTPPEGVSAEDIDNGNWVRHVLERDYDLVMVTPQTWLIPPAIVEQEELETADQDDLEEWMDENVFDKFPDSTATIALMTVVDLGRGYVKPGVDGAHMDTIPISIIEDAETFTEEDLLQTLQKQQFNLLDVVKSGTLVFFLPLDLTNTKIDAIRAEEETAFQNLNDSTLRGLANEQNIPNLAAGLAEIEAVDDPEELAEDITEEAQRWRRVISE